LHRLTHRDLEQYLQARLKERSPDTVGSEARGRIGDRDSVRIGLAGQDEVRGRSSGEVKKPETIDSRTHRPVEDGLFCERIFGPEEDWECACGEHRGTGHEGTICDRCGVEVARSRVRRERMGDIELAAPVVHIWFFKATPSLLGTLLDMKATGLEWGTISRDCMVVDPGDTPLKERQLLS
jgi:DNA-directed RNA polymerase subunit beta'